MKVTNKQISQFREVASFYLKFSKTKNKVYHAATKLLKKTTNAMEDYVDAQNEKRWELALTEGKDKEKAFVMDGDRYKYTSENQIKLNKELRELSKKEVDIEPHFVGGEDLPVDLSFEYTGNDGNTYTLSDYEIRTAFEEFIIKAEEEK